MPGNTKGGIPTTAEISADDPSYFLPFVFYGLAPPIICCIIAIIYYIYYA